MGLQCIRCEGVNWISVLDVWCSHGRERLAGRYASLFGIWAPSLKGNLLPLSSGYSSLMFVRLLPTRYCRIRPQVRSSVYFAPCRITSRPVNRIVPSRLFLDSLPPPQVVWVSDGFVYEDHCVGDRVRAQASLCDLYGGQYGSGTGFSPSTSCFPSQHRCTSAPYSFIVFSRRYISNLHKRQRR